MIHKTWQSNKHCSRLKEENNRKQTKIQCLREELAQTKVAAHKSNLKTSEAIHAPRQLQTHSKVIYRATNK